MSDEQDTLVLDEDTATAHDPTLLKTGMMTPPPLLLAEPERLRFADDQIRWKVQVSRKDKKGYDEASGSWVDPPNLMYVAYIDARDVQDKLDEIFTPLGWQTHYDVLHDIAVSRTSRQTGDLEKQYRTDAVRCTLKLFTGRSWVEKQGLAEPSYGTEPVKGGRSGAFKLAALEIGVGREMYSMPRIVIQGNASGDGRKVWPPRDADDQIRRKLEQWRKKQGGLSATRGDERDADDPEPESEWVRAAKKLAWDIYKDGDDAESARDLAMRHYSAAVGATEIPHDQETLDAYEAALANTAPV